MSAYQSITSPDDPALARLCQALAERGAALDESRDWPREQLQLCARHGVYEWFLPVTWGGQEWSEANIVRGYLALSAACLTTAFIITQFAGALRRIVVGENDDLRRELLPDLVTGRKFATVGISHLTTSRRHLGKPVLSAAATERGLVLDGYSPWVTGAPAADSVVIGATLADGREVLVALPTDLPGVEVPPAARLVGLTASQTGPVVCRQVEVERRWLLAGPVENVMNTGAGANTGGLQTSTLAVGLAGAVIEYLAGEAKMRAELSAPLMALRLEHDEVQGDLLALAEGESVCSSQELRVRANSLALRASQAALAAAKGTGYIVGHPAGRWCREALFFLVWSCPQPVISANLCELAGLAE